MSPPRAWRTPEGELLVQGASGELGYGADELEVQPAVFYLVCGNGVKRFGEPQGYTIEDEIGTVNIHVVRDSELVVYHWRQRAPYPPEVDMDVLLRGLIPVDDVPAQALLAIDELELARGREAADWQARLQAWREEQDAAVARLAQRVAELGLTQGTWQYGDSHSQWVVRALDGTELGTGPVPFQGKDAFAEVRKGLPDPFQLRLKLSEADGMSFDNH